MADKCTATLQSLQLKHPSPPSDRRPIAPPDESVPQVSFTESSVRRAVLSFPAGSSGGVDGLTPQHLKDMITIQGQSGPLLTALTSFINLIATHGVPESIKAIFFGGRLIALKKKDGGIRPIVVGLCLRRLVSKLMNNYAIDKISNLISPTQLGVGVAGGVEAAVHAARRYVDNLNKDEAVVKLDFCNAFNTLRRDSILEAIHATLPEMYSYVHASYASSSNLSYDNTNILSQEGIQQGDPIGPMLFCLTLHPVISRCSSELRIAYLDDITLGGHLASLSVEVNCLKRDASEIGLALNESKCEIISDENISSLPSSLSRFITIKRKDAMLLGSPLLREDAMNKELNNRVLNLKSAASRLKLLPSHDALVILKHSLSIPKVLHILCTSNCADHPA